MQQNKGQKKDTFMDVDLKRVFRNTLRTLKRVWLAVLLVATFFAAAMALIQYRNYTPRYKAYCTFSVHVINKATLSDTNSLYSVYYDQDLAEQLDATFSYLINSDFLSDDIKEYMGTETIDGSFEASNIEGSNIFVITAYSSTPKKAGEILRALKDVYYDAARFVLGDMETEIIEGPVVLKEPFNSPNIQNGIIIGAALGIMLCVGVAVLYSVFRRSVFEPSDLEKYINMQCFGVVPLLPTIQNLSDDPGTISATQEQSSFRESIRGIANKLEQALESREAKVVLVTSTVPGEGKSVLSQNLAESFAYWGKNVVLIDGDLRKPVLYKRLGYKHEKMSLANVLTEKADINTVVRQRWDGKLTCVLNTVSVENPTVLIDSDAMRKMISSFAEHADLVIVDTPPCGQISDVSVYQQYVDGILYVVQQDLLSISHIVEAAESLDDTENKLFGYVLNGAQHINQGYGKYGYGKYGYGKYGSYGKYGYSNYGESHAHSKETESIQEQ